MSVDVYNCQDCTLHNHLSSLWRRSYILRYVSKGVHAMVSFKLHFSSSPRVQYLSGNKFVSISFHQHVERVATIVDLNAYLTSRLQWALG